ncbi:MAG: isoprenylcysteine carboxylmethyltransferase family protein [Methanoregula sp.]
MAEGETVGQKSRIKGMVSSFIFTAVMGILLFVPAGTLDWPMAWILLGLFIVNFNINNLVIKPGLIEERYQRHKDSKKWDRYLVTVIILTGFFSMIVAGLDYRFGWTNPFPISVLVIALGMVILSYVLTIWAMISNPFFSATIRIQNDRGHSVVTHGPYRYVRHPGYVGMILNVIFTPLVLGSTWALVPAVIAIGLHVVRTYLEDKTLQAELAGYRDYTGLVRYRLVPGVW